MYTNITIGIVLIYLLIYYYVLDNNIITVFTTKI